MAGSTSCALETAPLSGSGPTPDAEGVVVASVWSSSWVGVGIIRCAVQEGFQKSGSAARGVPPAGKETSESMRPQPPPRARPHAAASEPSGALASVPSCGSEGTPGAPPAASAGADLPRDNLGRVRPDSKKFAACGKLSPNGWRIEIFRHLFPPTRLLGSFSARCLNADPPATNRRNFHRRASHGMRRASHGMYLPA